MDTAGNMRQDQPSSSQRFERNSLVQEAILEMAQSGREQRGAVYTKTEVVDFMLDLIGYDPSADLTSFRILEPSFGEGDFLFAVIYRLLESFQDHHARDEAMVDKLSNCLVGVELHQDTYKKTRCGVEALLEDFGLAKTEAHTVSGRWLIQDDFLLSELAPGFTHIVGNPPYVRQEMIPQPLIEAYREVFATIYDRADLYIPFFERSLSLLSRDGKLSFICSDRWMKNRFGGPLRKLIAERYHVEHYVDMVNTDAFKHEVSAYPAIVTITRIQGTVTRVAKKPLIEKSFLSRLAKSLNNSSQETSLVTAVPYATQGNAPWLLDSAEQLALVRKLEERFASLEAEGCKIGIGVATGSDRVYIQPYEALDVEEGRKLPLIMAPDIRSGQLLWRGKGVVNPFDDAGQLVDLKDYPRLAAYFTAHEAAIRQRNVAKRSPHAWYRTIDRIYQPLARQPKLLIPDIMHKPTIVFEKGTFYPHHNLYWITSEIWDLRALQTVLRSSIAKFFISLYSVRMRGGYLRYQAQNLRRIRLPAYQALAAPLRQRLLNLAEADDIEAVDAATFELYGLKSQDVRLIRRSLAAVR